MNAMVEAPPVAPLPSSDGASAVAPDTGEPTPMGPRSAQPAVEDRAAQRNLYLRGRPRVKDFVQYVRSEAVSPPSEGELADAWQEAHAVIGKLAKEEAGAADGASIRKLGPEYEHLLIEFLRDPLVRHGFNTVPTEVAMVDLDRMVVYQKHIDLNFAEELGRRLGPAPTDEQIFRFCLLHDHNRPPVEWSRVDGDKVVFVSPSNDLRYLGLMPLEPTQITNYPPPGDLVGVVSAGVGFGSNFFNAVCAEGRLILHNGSHRAYALRKLGITHAPCIVQHVSTRAELDLVAPSRVRRHPDRYLKDPRPSMLKDYFDSRLHILMEVRRRLHMVTVKFQVDQDWVPAL